jgi:hypothetical protein
MAFLYNRVSSTILRPLNSTVDNVLAIAKGAICLFSSIFGSVPNPATILSGLALIGASLINSIKNAVIAVINRRVNQMLGALLAPVRQIEAIISDLTKILIDVQNLIDKAKSIENYFKGKQDCSNQVANLINCIAQSAINQITNKVAMNIDKNIGKIADDVSIKAFSANGSIRGYLDRNTKFLEKAQLQTKLLV